jgi:hypothetical protein
MKAVSFDASRNKVNICVTDLKEGWPMNNDADVTVTPARSAAPNACVGIESTDEMDCAVSQLSYAKRKLTRSFARDC